MKNRLNIRWKLRVICSYSMTAGALFLCVQANSITSLTSDTCNSGLNITVSSATRSSTTSDTDCQQRLLDGTSGFSLLTSTPSGATIADSSAMVSAGGELYEAFVSSARESAVLLTPNRALMMSRSVAGDGGGINWDMGLAVQPVASATSAWLNGTYTLLRANREVRVVDVSNQSNEALSEVFDPVTLRIAFDGASGCTVSGHSSWFSYSLTTDPAGAFSQPDGSDYGLHQAVYAGEGYAGSNGVHEDASLTYSNCDYTLGSDGKLLITYDYTDGDAAPHSVENAYFLSADLRYIVSTLNAGSNIYRGFEMGVRVPTLLGTQDENNDSVAGTYLFNAPSAEFQGSTGDAVDNVHQNSEKVTQCMGRGALVLSTTAGSAGHNTCTYDITNTCSVRNEQGAVPSVSITQSTAEGVDSSAACEYQVSSNGSIDFSVNLLTAEGSQNLTFSGAIADNNETLILRSKYVGTDMTAPSNSNAPERTIKNDLVVGALVGIKYEGSLLADADTDGLDNLGEFVYSNYSAASGAKNDFNGDGVSDVFWYNSGNGASQNWLMSAFDRNSVVYNAYNGNLSFTPIALGDLDADSDSDIFWRNTSTGQNTVWLMDGGVRNSVVYTNAFLKAGYVFAGLGDFDGDGDKDIFWRGTVTGQNQIWTMNAGGRDQQVYPKAAPVDFSIKAIGDFNNDGVDDLLWQKADGTTQVWLMSNNDRSTVEYLPYMNTSYSVVGAGDFDNNGTDDILIRNSVTGQNTIWVMDGGNRASQAYISAFDAGGNYKISSIGDFDGDGDGDIFWRNTITGQNRIWEMDANARSSQQYPLAATASLSIIP